MLILSKNKRFCISVLRRALGCRCCSNAAKPDTKQATSLLGTTYPADQWTNIRPKILEKVGRNLHNQKHHPLGLIKRQIQQHFYKTYIKRGNPIFSVYDNLHPVVTTAQNFDSLRVAPDHPSRQKTDTYYLNVNHLLRTHTTAHQSDLITSGLNSFIMVGDVYRRDAIDFQHYPVFHQLDGVKLFNRHELFGHVENNELLHLFESSQSERLDVKQADHTKPAAVLVAADLKNTLEGMVKALFGEEIESRWVSAFFPFTHPSWELEIKYQDEWIEMLGCGVIEQQILQKAGAGEKVGWAFGLGLERLAMKLYNIPDIRLFWSEDPSFHKQFQVDDPATKITYKPFGKGPNNTMDISFWIPAGFHENDFYDLARSLGGDLLERVELIDDFFHPKHERQSHCYRVTYRHAEKPLSNTEVNVIHEEIGREVERLGGEVRINR